MNILRLLIGLLLAVVASVVLGQLYGPRLFDTRPSRPIQVKPASQPTQAVPPRGLPLRKRLNR